MGKVRCPNSRFWDPKNIDVENVEGLQATLFGADNEMTLICPCKFLSPMIKQHPALYRKYISPGVRQPHNKTQAKISIIYH